MRLKVDLKVDFAITSINSLECVTFITSLLLGFFNKAEKTTGTSYTFFTFKLLSYITFLLSLEVRPMAVPQARTTRSKRGMRRAHDSLSGPTLSINNETGETHRRHHISKLGYYRGRQVLQTKAVETAHDHHGHNHDHSHNEE